MIENMGNDFLLNEAIAERDIYYRLGESEIFQYANSNSKVSGMNLVDILPKMVVNGQGFYHIGLDKLDKVTLYEIFDSNKRFSISGKDNLKQLLDSGKVQMVVSHEYKVPTALPFIVQSTKTSSTIYVNVSDFLDLNEYGQYTITQVRNYSGMFAILLAAGLAYRIVSHTGSLPKTFTNSLAVFYSAMLERVISSISHIDPISRDKVRYLATEFSLVQMYGTGDGTKRFQLDKAKLFPKLETLITDSIDSQFHIDSFDTLSEFLSELARIYPSMKNLNLATVIPKWIRLYGSASTLALDYIGYQIYTMCMTLIESPLINRHIMLPLLEKHNGAELYRQIQNII